MERSDLPIISLPTDSTKVDGVPAVTVSPTQPARPAPKPANGPAPAAPRAAAAPAPAPAPAPASAAPAKPAAREEDDPEKLLREYTDRQKSKIAKLEQQLAESQRIAVERDALKARVQVLDAEVAQVKRQLQAASKSDEVIRDLQQKLDASLLSHSMIGAENAKLKMRAQEMEGAIKASEEKAAHAEKSAREALVARQETDLRVAAAMQALQGKGPAPKK